MLNETTRVLRRSPIRSVRKLFVQIQIQILNLRVLVFRMFIAANIKGHKLTLSTDICNTDVPPSLRTRTTTAHASADLYTVSQN